VTRTIGLGRETPEDIQESEDIKLSSIMNTSMSKRKDGPNSLKKSNVKRDIDSSKNQIRGNLTEHISRTPNSVGIIEFVPVEPKILFHPTVCITCPEDNILKALVILT
jgi:predicted metal-dependent phosphotriesterase family hydrolase